MSCLDSLFIAGHSARTSGYHTIRLSEFSDAMNDGDGDIVIRIIWHYPSYTCESLRVFQLFILICSLPQSHKAKMINSATRFARSYDTTRVVLLFISLAGITMNVLFAFSTECQDSRLISNHCDLNPLNPDDTLLGERTQQHQPVHGDLALLQTSAAGGDGSGISKQGSPCTSEDEDNEGKCDNDVWAECNASDNDNDNDNESDGDSLSYSSNDSSLDLILSIVDTDDEESSSSTQRSKAEWSGDDVPFFVGATRVASSSFFSEQHYGHGYTKTRKTLVLDVDLTLVYTCKKEEVERRGIQWDVCLQFESTDEREPMYE